MRVHARKKYATVEIHPLKGIKISWLLKKYVYRIGAHFVLHTKERALKKRIISVPSLLLYYCTRVVPSEVAIYVISRLVVDWGAQGDMGWYMTSLFSPPPFRGVPARFSRTKNQSFRCKLKRWNWSKLHKKFDHFKKSLPWARKPFWVNILRSLSKVHRTIYTSTE